MNTEQIKTRIRGRFKPFVLHLSDGRKFKVDHPEFIMVGKRVVFVLRKDDLAETIDALHIVSVEDLDQPAPSSEGAK